MSPSSRKTRQPTPGETIATAGGHPSLRVPVEARGVGIVVLAMVAMVWTLDWAQSFFVSLLVGILIAYTLNPLVDALQRVKIPRVVATTVVMMGVLAALVFGTYSLRGQMQTIINQLPAASSKLSAGLANLRQSQQRTMQKVQSAAQEFEKATKPATATPPPPPPPKPLNPDPEDSADAEAKPDTATVPVQPLRIVVEQPSFKWSNYLWAGSVGAIGFLGQMLMVLFLVFFLLLTGDTFKRKLVRIAGPSLSKKRIAVVILDDINQSIQRYMFMLLTTNIMVGLLCWMAFRLIGLDNAGAWAVAAGVLHLVPYLGPAVTAGVTGMAAFLQFDSFSTALLVAGASLVVATLIGTFVTTWMTGRIAKMNTAAVFISLLFWGWLWGVWGLLLGIPIIVIIKVVSQQVEQLHPVAELLGE
jgi:predicted PurR-regulated permease PerM